MAVQQSAKHSYVHEVSVVVPVYRGETTLAPLVNEVAILSDGTCTPGGHRFRVIEILLVHDNGPDESAAVIRSLALSNPLVRSVWLSRNFGQHAATLAGVASSGGEWIATLDEDGQHVPGDIGLMLDQALDNKVQLVYGRHDEAAPHPWWRNASSALARRVGRWMAGSDLQDYSSFRLILGAHARAVAAYCGPRIFLDSALRWAIGSSSTCVVSTRPEWRDGSGYKVRSLFSHFWTLVLSSGTRPLRIVSFIGTVWAFTGFAGAIAIAIRQLRTDYDVPGWASVVVALLVTSGLTLFALGVVAEYIGALLRSVQGRPLYVITDDPEDGPLGQRARG